MNFFALFASFALALASSIAQANPVGDDPHIDNPSIPGSTPTSPDDGMGGHHTDSPDAGFPGGSDIDNPSFPGSDDHHTDGGIDNPSFPGGDDFGL
jgi:hypothetical protein